MATFPNKTPETEFVVIQTSTGNHFLNNCKVEGKYKIDINEEMWILSMRQNINMIALKKSLYVTKELAWVN